MVQVEGKETN